MYSTNYFKVRAMKLAMLVKLVIEYDKELRLVSIQDGAKVT
jgi:hypothetical protein